MSYQNEPGKSGTLTASHISPDHFKSLAEIESGYFWNVSRNNWLLKFIRQLNLPEENVKLVDYGCGTGGTVVELKHKFRFRQLLGVDTSEIAINLALRKMDAFRRIEPGDFSILRDCDLVLLMDVIEHIDDDETFLSSILTSLPEGGSAIVTVPAMPMLMSKWDRQMGHFRRYDMKGLRQTVELAGGKIIESRYIFSYLVPAAMLRRLEIGNTSQGCEFPTVSPSMNKILVALNRLEVWMAKFSIKPLFGTSIIALIKLNPNDNRGGR